MTNHDPAIPDWTSISDFTIEQMHALSKTPATMRPITFERALREMLARYEKLEAENRRLKAPRVTDELRQEVRANIDMFQDIIGWQKGESRNALVCEIRDKIDALLESRQSKGQPEEPK